MRVAPGELAGLLPVAAGRGPASSRVGAPVMKLLQAFHASNLHNGVDRVSLTLARGLRDAGVELEAIVPEEGAVPAALRGAGIDVTLSRLGCCDSLAWRAAVRFLSRARARADEIGYLLAEGHFDAVIANTGHLIDAALAAGRARVPLIWHIHSPFEEDFARYRELMPAEAYAWLLGSLGSRTVAVSADVAQSLSAWMPAEVIEVVHNGVDLDELRTRATDGDQPVRAELGLPDDARLVLGVGRICRQKDFATFVRVAERMSQTHPNTYFVIAGPDDEQPVADALRAHVLAAGLQSRCVLLGARDDVPRLMAASDVVLSTAIFEGQGMTTIEAMALSKPVVAMACVGLRECIRHNADGLLTPLGDVEATAQAVGRVLDDSGLAIDLGIQARQSAEARFSKEAYSRAFLAVAERAISKPRLPDPGSVEVCLALMQQIAKLEARALRPATPQPLHRRFIGKLDELVHRRR